MKQFSLLLVAVVAAATSTCLVAGQGRGIGKPARCGSGGKRYSVIMTVMDRVGSDNITSMEVQMDHVKGKMAVVNYTWPISSEKPGTWSNKFLIDFNEEKIYVILPDPDMCFNYSYNVKPEIGIPDRAQHVMSGYLGSRGGGKVMFDMWRYKLSMTESTDPAYVPTVTLAVTRDTCVPILQGVHIPGPEPVDQVYMISDFQAKLTDHSAFDLPASCQK